MKPRSSLLLGVVASAVAAAGIGFFIVFNFAPDAAKTRVFVDLGLVALLAGVVVAFTRSPAQRVAELDEALRELTRGIRSRRLTPEQFGDLEPVARAFNDVAAFLSEHDDPNLGPVKSKPRFSPPEEQRRRRGDEEHSYHPELGAVRVIGKGNAARPARSVAPSALDEADDEQVSGDLLNDERVGEPRPARLSIIDAADDEDEDDLEREAREVSKAESAPPSRAENDTFIDEAPEVTAPEARAEEDEEPDDEPDDEDVGDEDVSDAAGPGSRVEAASEAPNGEDEDEDARDLREIRALFDAFVEAKRRRDEPVDDLDFEEFAETLLDERRKLRSAHKCRDVRFEVTVEGGEVSLLPRLLR